MAATYMTASTASGYMTNVMADVAVGPFRCFTAHYSSPGTTSQYVTPGMGRIVFVNVQDADATSYAFATNSAGGLDVYWSGQASGSTGFIFILGF